MQKLDLKAIKEKYDADGYVVLPGFLSQEQIDTINQEIKAFIKDIVPRMPENFIFYEDKNDPATLKQLQEIYIYSQFFNKILNGSQFEVIASFLLGERAVGKNLEYFNKPSRIGKPTPPHQDAYYFMLNPPNAITMWMALEKVDEQNGCMRYIKGSHLQPMRTHGRTKTLGFSQGIVDYGQKEFETEIVCPAEPGDLLIHHAMTIHRADANPSERSRRALGFIYFGESAKEDMEAKGAYQKKLQEEKDKI